MSFVLNVDNQILTKGLLASKTSWEHPAAQFCADWLMGKEWFEIYTSGSTGEPKQIKLSQQQMLAAVSLTASAIPPLPTDHLFMVLSTQSVGGLMQLCRAMCWDLPITILTSSTQVATWFALEPSFTWASFVPLQWAALQQHPQAIRWLQQFRVILLGGAPLNPHDMAFASQLNGEVYHSYGMTETCGHVALRRINGQKVQPGFKPIAPVKICLNPNQQIAIHSPSAITSPLITNDLGKYLDTDYFEIIGRADAVIISGAVKILTEETEKKLAEWMQSKEHKFNFFAAGRPHPLYGQELVVVIEGATIDQHQNWLGEWKLYFPKYKAPKAIIFAPEFKTTASGKLDKKATLASINNGKK